MDFSKASDIVRNANVIALTNYKNQSSYFHACRVAEYVDANPMIRGYDKDCCIALALLHDLFEDTNYDGEGLEDDMISALSVLTHPQHLDYVEYIQSIRNTQGETWREWAYWVKVADMKDHLMQRETLTEKLKEKYWEAIPYLL